MKKNSICIIGWYYFHDLYEKLDSSGIDISVVKHRNNDEIENKFKNIKYYSVENIGFEMGGYNWYIKNIWDGSSNILFMHDDVDIDSIDSLNRIINRCNGTYQSYVIGSKKNKGYIGPNKRCIYLSVEIIKLLLEDYNGFWYDEKNIIEDRKDFPFELTNRVFFEEDVDQATKSLNLRMIDISVKHNISTRQFIYDEDIIFYKNGKEKIYFERKKNLYKKRKPKKQSKRNYQKELLNVVEPYRESKKIIKSYSKFVCDKNVVIVGPSPDIMSKKQGEYIDSFDVVVRINKGYFINPDMEKFVGKKTDILYSTLADTREKNCGRTGKFLPIKDLSEKLKWLICLNPYYSYRINNFKRKYLRNRIPLCVIDYDKYLFFKKITNRPLSSGFITIMDLLSYNIKSLYITGFTFYQNYKNGNENFYYNGYQEDSKWSPFLSGGKGHAVDIELLYLREIIKRDDRIKTNKILGKIINKKFEIG